VTANLDKSSLVLLHVDNDYKTGSGKIATTCQIWRSARSKHKNFTYSVCELACDAHKSATHSQALHYGSRLYCQSRSACMGLAIVSANTQRHSNYFRKRRCSDIVYWVI